MGDVWMTHCPACRMETPVAPNAQAATCRACEHTFAPSGLATAQLRAAPKPTVDPNDPLVGERLGKWRITRALARGGMGRVYAATDRFRRRQVAIKVLREDLARDASFRKRFDRESKVLEGLVHPHIVSVMDRGEDEGRFWFAMDYVRGESLRQRMAGAPLPAIDALTIASEIASALVYAHARGVVHRDLKPENVLLDEEGRVRLVDFGLSKLVPSAQVPSATQLTHTDVIMGTFEYMAPEQRRGDKETDPRSDLFALGVLLYEMLTGTLPVGRFELPSEHSVDVSRRLDTIVARALATDPDNRYASATAMLEDLEQALRGGPEPQPVTEAAAAALPSDDGERVLRHVEILSALDRILGIVALLAAMGVPKLVAVLAPVQPSAARGIAFGGSLALIIVGVLLFRQGSRLGRLASGSREGQITTSIILLFFPPFLTGLGLYGIWALTSERARRAFRKPVARIGSKPRRALDAGVHLDLRRDAPAARSLKAPANFPSPLRLRSTSWILRLFALGASLWFMNSVLIWLDVVIFESAGSPFDYSQLEQYVKGSVVANIAALVGLIYTISQRKVRRGTGLAIFAFLLVSASTVALSLAYEQADDLIRSSSHLWESSPTHGWLGLLHRLI